MGKLIVSFFNFIANLTAPAMLTLLLLVIVGLLCRKKFARYLLVFTIVLFYFIANGIIPQLLIKPLESPFNKASNATIQHHRALILLGAGIIQAHQTITPGLFAYPRIVEAARIYHLGIKDGIHYLIFISGGATGKTAMTEAKLYGTVLQQMGVPAKQIILENKSKNTFQNAEFVKPLLKRYHITRALLVTSAIHMRRALRYFHYFNINVTPAPADFATIHLGWFPLAYNLTFASLGLHEWYGLLRLDLYNFFGLNKEAHALKRKV